MVVRVIARTVKIDVVCVSSNTNVHGEVDDLKEKLGYGLDLTCVETGSRKGLGFRSGHA